MQLLIQLICDQKHLLKFKLNFCTKVELMVILFAVALKAYVDNGVAAVYLLKNTLICIMWIGWYTFEANVNTRATVVWIITKHGQCPCSLGNQYCKLRRYVGTYWMKNLCMKIYLSSKDTLRFLLRIENVLFCSVISILQLLCLFGYFVFVWVSCACFRLTNFTYYTKHYCIS